MAESLNNIGGAVPEFGPPNNQRRGDAADDPPLPPSKPLHIFLLIALVITGAAYVQDEWVQMTSSVATAPHPSRLRRLVQNQSDYLDHSQKGLAAMKDRRSDNAVSEFRLALQDENLAEGHENLGQAMLGQGNPDAAFAQFKEALVLDPKRMSVYSAWGQALSSEGKLDEAQSLYRGALHLNRDDGTIHYDLAMTLQALQRSAEARSRMAASAGDTADAEIAATKAADLCAQALEHYAQASRHDVNFPAFWSGYGQMLNSQGKFAEAVSRLNRAVTQDPTLAQAHFQLALAQDRLGQYRDAIAHYEIVLSLIPDDPDTLNNLALLYAVAADPQARSSKMAVLLATRACDATTDQNARFMDTLARSYAADGDFFQAITWEDKASHRAAQLRDHELARELQARYSRFLDHKAD
jgi:tetratricopeptide (TPR) repeat protein